MDNASERPSTSRLAGQLGYLFEEEPELARASVEALADRLNHEDRYARARSRYPLESDAEVRARIDEFGPRITPDDVGAALRQIGHPGRGPAD